MALARIPDPPAEYDQVYMQQLVRILTLHLRTLENPGPVTGTTLSLNKLPVASAGLRSGDVWRDAGAADVLKLVP